MSFPWLRSGGWTYSVRAFGTLLNVSFIIADEMAMRRDASLEDC
jgi:hypothetical protein